MPRCLTAALAPLALLSVPLALGCHDEGPPASGPVPAPARELPAPPAGRSA